MLQRPDPQSFTKFLASVGLFLCILALVGPGLVLRETKVLEIKETDLQSYTALARKELERRQRVTRDVAWAAPYVGGLLFVMGMVALIYSIPRLRRQERAEDARLEVELEKLRREIAPQDESERRARIEAEVAETSAEKGEPVTRDQAATEDETLRAPNGEKREPETQDAPPPLAAQAHARAELMRRVADTEERVLRQIGRISGSLYEFRPQVKVGRSSSLLLDGLLVSTVDQLPDVVIEIKFVSSVTHLSRRVLDALRQVDRYRSSPELRNAKLWLIVVTEDRLGPVHLERVAEAAARSGDEVIVSVIEADHIEDLELPRDRLL